MFMYNDWQYSNQISHRRLRYKNLDGQNKKANSTPFQKNKTKHLPSPYAYIALVTQRELKIVNDTLWEIINILILLNI